MIAATTPKTELSQHQLDVIAEHIEEVSRLKEKTILVLLQHMIGLAQHDIQLVLTALPLLEREFLKPAPTKAK